MISYDTTVETFFEVILFYHVMAVFVRGVMRKVFDRVKRQWFRENRQRLSSKIRKNKSKYRKLNEFFYCQESADWSFWYKFSENKTKFFTTDKKVFSLIASKYLLDDLKKFRQKWLVKKSKFVWRKKTQPEHKYSVTFVSKVGTTIKQLSKKGWWS